MPLGCALGMIVTMTVVILTHNLAQGVLAGIAISAVVFAWKITEIKIKVHNVEHNGNSYKIYRVCGQIFFASTSKFIEMFDYPGDPDEVIIDFKNSHVWDHSAVNAIMKIKQKYLNLGKKASFIGLNKESNSVVVKVDENILY
jgi:SulP family sulfate permease